MEKYIKIYKQDLPKRFRVEGNNVFLRDSCARPITISFPLILNEDIAKIPAMVMDGSISKVLAGCMFSQKKDLGLITEINAIIAKYFGIEGRRAIHKASQSHVLTYPKTFSSFLHFCLDIHKSDQSARIPRWIWVSPKSVVKEYLRYAFAMEGSVKDYRIGSEVRFHSCDKLYLKELKSLLNLKFDITSRILGYYIKNYGWKYYLCFEKKRDVKKFYNCVGIALKSHQERLHKIVKNFKSKAWKVTLVKIMEIKKVNFRSDDVRLLFPYLIYRSVHHRLTDLVKRKYLSFDGKNYTLTKMGFTEANSLKQSVRITPFRTYPKENERKILDFIKLKGKSFNAEIARELLINYVTSRDVLKRLLNKNKIEISYIDKFGRKYYKLKKENNPEELNPLSVP